MFLRDLALCNTQKDFLFVYLQASWNKNYPKKIKLKEVFPNTTLNPNKKKIQTNNAQRQS